MSRVVQISILGKISGNVNADEVIGTRITIKKMYTSNGEVLPFVSPRAIKYAIRMAFRDSNDKRFEIDPLYEDPRATTSLRLADSAQPDKYVDNDLFGYMKTSKEGAEKGEAIRRQAPIAISYFKALRDTPVKSEFAARFPRSEQTESNPVPFEVEVAEFIARLNVLIYDYIGDFTVSTSRLEGVPEKLDNGTRIARLSKFLEILLTPSYVLPRRTNSLNIPEYYVSLVCLSSVGPLPIYAYLDYKIQNGGVILDSVALNALLSRDDIKDKIRNKVAEFYIIDYKNCVSNWNELRDAKQSNLPEIIQKACEFLIE
jgi:CRISPR-associated protein Cst2